MEISEGFSSGNRISCLIENLHSDKKQDSDEEEEENVDTLEELKLGRRRFLETTQYRSIKV